MSGAGRGVRSVSAPGRMLTSRVLVLGLVAVTALSGGVIGQSEAPATVTPSIAETALPAPAEGTLPIRFSVAGPVRPHDTRLVLLTAQRSCRLDWQQPDIAAVSVEESAAEARIRLDAVTGPAGTVCESRDVVRVPVELAAPIGSRTIVAVTADADELAYVNAFDPIDTGFQYICGGVAASIADFVGPGLELDASAPASTITGGRAIEDSGDNVEYIGPFVRGRAEWEEWSIVDGRWDRVGWGSCTPSAVMPPGLDTAGWSLRGRRPGPRSRTIRVWVGETACASGQPPVGRIAPPFVQVHPGALVVIMATEPLGGPYEWRADSADSGGYDFIDCQGAPPAPFTVKLPVRIGKRALYDGGVLPPRKMRTRR